MIVPWITAEDTVDPTGDIGEWAAQVASWILFNLTGKKYEGIKTVTEYYSQDTFLFTPYSAQVIKGNFYNIPTGTNRYQGMTHLRLRHQPVLSVATVKTGGRLIPANEYQLRNNAYLVRNQKIPWIADPVNEIEVTYTYGTQPPMAGKRAAIRLANEFIWNEIDDERCSLPERISSSISREGVDYTILDPQEFIEKGKIGIPTIDFFIAAANPSRSKRKPKIVSPDTPRGERIN